MPTSPVPFVYPSQITFYLNQCPQTEKFCMYNPFPHEITFKVDNPKPSVFSLPLTQGLISSCNKLYIELTCTSTVTVPDGELQVRFFRCRSRHDQKPHVQKYIGFREVKLVVLTDHEERKRTCTDAGLVSLSKCGPSVPSFGSSIDCSSSRSTDPYCSGRRIQVIASLTLAVLLALFGFVISQTDGIWFATNIAGVTAQTFAVVCYTLACVLILQILTIR